MSKIEQSYKNLNKAFQSLEGAVATPPVEDRDYAGIIQCFEFTYELCWKTLKLLLEGNGIDAPFPRIVFEEAFKRDMIEGNEIWKDIMEARNLSTHTYNQELARKMCAQIKSDFVQIFRKTIQKMGRFVKKT